MKLKKLLFSFLFSLFIFGNYSYAANINWDGGGDGTSWTDPLNWAGDVMPGPADRAVFPSPVGALTVVKGAGTPNPIMGMWVFNNVTLALDLDLMIDGTVDPVRIFTNNTLTFKSGYTFNIKGTTRAIAYFNNNSTIIIEAGATVNVIAPQGIGTNPNAQVATLINRGTLNIDGGVHAMRPNDGSAWTIINEACGHINMDAQIRVWSTTAVSSFTNNGLVTYTGVNAGVSVSGNNMGTNNAFFNYPNSPGFMSMAAGNGTINENGINVANAANLVVDAALTCTADLGVEGAFEIFSDAAGANSLGTSSADGEITFGPTAFPYAPFPGASTQTVYTCYGNQFAFTVNNVSGACTSPTGTPVPTMSEWALIVFGLLLLNFGTMFILAGEKKLVLVRNSGQKVSFDNFNWSSLPFDKIAFFRNFVFVFALFTAIFLFSILGFGYEMTGADPYGSILASSLIAYWLMLYKLEKK